MMSRCPSALRASVLLFFVLLLLSGSPSRSQAAPMTGELRCQCINVVSKMIPLKHIANVELIPEGPYCAASEVIATMTNGKKVCLDITARWVKLIIDRILQQKSSTP
ncbi:interleukin-8 [Pogona vitticeps]|uniref:C-X-C motif chemokine n=1 Tax=Pogona vitticeps TaxID=103695 RepID=A0A6J0VA65_9SAUR|nr:growth-regulated alpha protein-like isoform X1 [Pogona vitticeps]XP_020669738.1 growth-regulated alpha protein-like isoform X2 [Pogona vitticeps]